MGKTRGGMPTERTIRSYWATRLWERKGFDSIHEFMEEGLCFACGMTCTRARAMSRRLERCHIEPRCDGGSDGADNLHMLCWVCHKDSEGLVGDRYWDWFWGRHWLDAAISLAARQGNNIYSDWLKWVKGGGHG
jgi:5-methylcytosine-specific restriction endonuclease McrA